jgi:hypothetical protein
VAHAAAIPEEDDVFGVGCSVRAGSHHFLDGHAKERGSGGSACSLEHAAAGHVVVSATGHFGVFG